MNIECIRECPGTDYQSAIWSEKNHHYDLDGEVAFCHTLVLICS